MTQSFNFLSRTSAAMICCLSGLLLAAAPPPAKSASPEPRPEIVKIQGPTAGLKLGLLHYPSARSGAPILLALHGQVLSHISNMGHPFGGRSMLRAIADTGIDVWALDFYGFGVSDRYPQMDLPPDQYAPLGQAEEAADQVAAAIAFLRSRNGGRPVMLLGDSGGAMVAGFYAARQPGTLSKLILYSPVTPFTDGSAPANLPAYTLWKPKDLWEVFTAWAARNPGEGTLDQRMYDDWAAAMLDSDASSRTRNPPSIKIPNGRAADQTPLAEGRYVFDPSKINVPTLILMGETDRNLAFPGGQWLLSQLRKAPHRRLVIIGNGSHTVQFEAERGEVYKAVSGYLHEAD